MAQFPGLSDRLAQRLFERGYRQNPPKRSRYRKPTSRQPRPDVMRFCTDHGYRPQYVYEWLNKGVTPTWENLRRLEKDLEAPIAWLLVVDVAVLGAATWIRGRRR